MKKHPEQKLRALFAIILKAPCIHCLLSLLAGNSLERSLCHLPRGEANGQVMQHHLSFAILRGFSHSLLWSSPNSLKGLDQMPFARTAVVPHPDPQESPACPLLCDLCSVLALGAQSGEDDSRPVSAGETFVGSSSGFVVSFSVLGHSQQSTPSSAQRALLPSPQSTSRQEAFIPWVPTLRNKIIHRSTVQSFVSSRPTPLSASLPCKLP